MAQSFELLQVMAVNKAIDYSLAIDDDVPVYLQFDALRLEQVLINLINNAIKFTDEGFVRVHVSYRGRNESRQAISIAIEDSGIGIPKDQ